MEEMKQKIADLEKEIQSQREFQEIVKKIFVSMGISENVFSDPSFLKEILIFCTEKDKKTGNILLSPANGEESIVIKSEDDVKTLTNCLMGYFRK